MKKTGLHVFCALFALPAFSTYAADGDTAVEKNLSIGVIASTAPKYSGSDEQTTGFAPYLRADYGNFFLDTLRGVGYGWEADNGFYFENSLSYNPGRSDKNSSWGEGSKKLKGMGKIKSSLDTNILVGWEVTNWLAIEGEAVLPLTESNGSQYSASAILTPYKSEVDEVNLTATALFADARYLNTYYGVNQKQSSRTGHSQFNTSGGYYGSNFGASWTHFFNENWSGGLTYDYVLLDNRVSDSPIVRKRGGSMASVAIAYTF